jgi:hypothetical protein
MDPWWSELAVGQAAGRGSASSRRERSGRTYPYEITCTACDARLAAIDREWVVLVGPRSIELIGDPDGTAHIACHRCGTMVPLDADLLSVR